MEANLGDIFRVYSELANKKKKLPIHRKKKKKEKAESSQPRGIGDGSEKCRNNAGRV